MYNVKQKRHDKAWKEESQTFAELSTQEDQVWEGSVCWHDGGYLHAWCSRYVVHVCERLPASYAYVFACEFTHAVDYKEKPLNNLDFETVKYISRNAQLGKNVFIAGINCLSISEL